MRAFTPEDYVDDGHRLLVSIGRMGLELDILCPHGDNPAETALCAWYRRRDGSLGCGLKMELGELGEEFLEYVSTETEEAVKVMGPIRMKWAVQHNGDDDPPELAWAPVPDQHYTYIGHFDNTRNLPFPAPPYTAIALAGLNALDSAQSWWHTVGDGKWQAGLPR